jgi:hypothetical protein
MMRRWGLTLLVILPLASTGCYCHHPCWGFRLHPCASPACYYPPRKPLLHHKFYKYGYPLPEAPCETCVVPPTVSGAVSLVAPVVPSYPVATTPVIVGQPSPLPPNASNGANNGSALPYPMPMKKEQ